MSDSSNFVWNGGAGDFDDPNQWYELTAESTGTLAPGANDTIFLGVVTQDDNQFGAPSGVINGSGSAAGAQTIGDGADTFTLNVNLTPGVGGFSNNDTIDVTGGDIEDGALWQNFNAALTVSAGVINAR